MPARPNFTEVQLIDGNLRVKGNSNDDPLPIEIRVFLEQEDPATEGPAIAVGSVDKLTTAWQADLSSEGFSTGPALASGVEIRMEPFTAITWTQQVQIN